MITPAPQGVGVFAFSGWKEVIEMTDDDTDTTRMWYRVNRSITLRGNQARASGASSPRGTRNEEEYNV
jgi:hypothetical protein